MNRVSTLFAAFVVCVACLFASGSTTKACDGFGGFGVSGFGFNGFSYGHSGGVFVQQAAIPYGFQSFGYPVVTSFHHGFSHPAVFAFGHHGHHGFRSFGNRNRVLVNVNGGANVRVRNGVFGGTVIRVR